MQFNAAGMGGTGGIGKTARDADEPPVDVFAPLRASLPEELLLALLPDADRTFETAEADDAVVRFVDVVRVRILPASREVARDGCETAEIVSGASALRVGSGTSCIGLIFSFAVFVVGKPSRFSTRTMRRSIQSFSPTNEEHLPDILKSSGAPGTAAPPRGRVDRGGEKTFLATPPLLAFLAFGDFAAAALVRITLGEPLEDIRALTGVLLNEETRVATGEVILGFAAGAALGSVEVELAARRVGFLFTSCCTRGLLDAIPAVLTVESSDFDFF